MRTFILSLLVASGNLPTTVALAAPVPPAPGKVAAAPQLRYIIRDDRIDATTSEGRNLIQEICQFQGKDNLIDMQARAGQLPVAQVVDCIYIKPGVKGQLYHLRLRQMLTDQPLADGVPVEMNLSYGHVPIKSILADTASASEGTFLLTKTAPVASPALRITRTGCIKTGCLSKVEVDLAAYLKEAGIDENLHALQMVLPPERYMPAPALPQGPLAQRATPALG